MMQTKSRLRSAATVFMFMVVLVGGLALNSPTDIPIITAGPIQAGHAEVDCVACHVDSPGSTRQQIQANVSFAMGQRNSAVNFGYSPVTSDQCLDCHERTNERHPIYRFNEPRFATARKELGANSCFGCHSEHQDARVFVKETFCSTCHSDLTLKVDPLDVSHVELIAEKKWGTCLGCHDFHGNHPHKPQTILADAFEIQDIRDYLKNGADPYGGPKIYKAKSK